MASADVLLVNMWCHDIGREHGAGKPLLKTARGSQHTCQRALCLVSLCALTSRAASCCWRQVFQVNLKLFSPRRTVLVFVIRDRCASFCPGTHLLCITVVAHTDACCLRSCCSSRAARARRRSSSRHAAHHRSVARHAHADPCRLF
jgi:hypothetical protein